MSLGVVGEVVEGEGEEESRRRKNRFSWCWCWVPAVVRRLRRSLT